MIHLQPKCREQVEEEKQTRNHSQKLNLTIKRYTTVCMMYSMYLELCWDLL